jgi:2-hydroxychromene-2-carboxylate isomerase
MAESIVFYFDPMCPYAYQTSVWIRDVRSRTPLDITWKFFSLEEVNLVAGKRHPWERPWSYGFGQMRVGVLIRRELGNDALDRWYETIGSAFFYGGLKTHVPEMHAKVIGDAGFDPSFVERAIADDTTLAEARAQHEDAVASVPTASRRSCSNLGPSGPPERASTVTRYTDPSSCRRRRATTPWHFGSSPKGCSGSRISTSCGTPRPWTTCCTSARSSRRISRPATGRPSRIRRPDPKPARRRRDKIIRAA